MLKYNNIRAFTCRCLTKIFPPKSYLLAEYNGGTQKKLRKTDRSKFASASGQMDMARSTRLVILIKNIYTLWGRKRFLLPVTYFPTNLVYPFTLRVTDI